jgi:hypothetical protein
MLRRQKIRQWYDNIFGRRLFWTSWPPYARTRRSGGGSDATLSKRICTRLLSAATAPAGGAVSSGAIAATAPFSSLIIDRSIGPFPCIRVCPVHSHTQSREAGSLYGPTGVGRTKTGPRSSGGELESRRRGRNVATRTGSMHGVPTGLLLHYTIVEPIRPQKQHILAVARGVARRDWRSYNWHPGSRPRSSRRRSRRGALTEPSDRVGWHRMTGSRAWNRTILNTSGCGDGRIIAVTMDRNFSSAKSNGNCQ